VNRIWKSKDIRLISIIVKYTRNYINRGILRMLSKRDYTMEQYMDSILIKSPKERKSMKSEIRKKIMSGLKKRKNILLLNMLSQMEKSHLIF